MNVTTRTPVWSSSKFTALFLRRNRPCMVHGACCLSPAHPSRRTCRPMKGLHEQPSFDGQGGFSLTGRTCSLGTLPAVRVARAFPAAGMETACCFPLAIRRERGSQLFKLSLLRGCRRLCRTSISVPSVFGMGYESSYVASRRRKHRRNANLHSRSFVRCSSTTTYPA